MKELTIKQKKFCEKYIELGNKMEAYKQSYSASKMADTTINKCVQELFNNHLITTYINKLQKENVKEFKHTLTDSLKYDFALIDRYNKHLEILEDPEAKEDQLKASRRTMSFIGAQGFNAAMDRVSKKLGFYEKDNQQKAGDLNAEEKRLLLSKILEKAKK